jgi:DNA mismatch endonuclease (patch repair protein)
MVDVFTPEKRSEVMSMIRSKGTKLEEKGFALLRLAGLNFRKHPKGIYGRPDAGNKSKKIAVFFDSDFWHGYQYKKKLIKRLPAGYWPEKIARNIQRDKIVTKRLLTEGWLVLRFWEHEITRNPEKCVKRIRTAIFTSSPNQK